MTTTSAGSPGITDVTEALGVLKWEPPVPVGMGGKVKGGFPRIPAEDGAFGGGDPAVPRRLTGRGR